jgi:hypothetical protein
MKINPYFIIIDHWRTLVNDKTNRLSVSDFAIFYGTPASISLLFYDTSTLSDNNFYNLSVTFFGIFIALLLNLQVAMFGIFQRKWRKEDDPHMAAADLVDLNLRRAILRQINSNISYTILFSTIALFTYIAFFAFSVKKSYATMISIFTYLHLILTLLMVIKRAHALFAKEYDKDSM